MRDPTTARTGRTRAEQIIVRRDVAQIAQTADADPMVALYTVPVNFTATGRVYVTERSGTARTFGIALSPAGASIANQHYVAGPTAAIMAHENGHTEQFEKLPAACVVRVVASSADVSFSWVGIEEPVP
jgi:hypothetical protein